jgi:Flp pilus assembly pilin Flp
MPRTALRCVERFRKLGLLTAGQDLIEYALLIGMIAATALVGLSGFGVKVPGFYEATAAALPGDESPGNGDPGNGNPGNGNPGNGNPGGGNPGGGNPGGGNPGGGNPGGGNPGGGNPGGGNPGGGNPGGGKGN